MKRIGFLLAAALIAGCSNTSTQVEQHEMVVSPKTLVYQPTDSVKTLSITHTCTCPFSWNCYVLPPNNVLYDTSGVGDQTNVSIKVHRENLTVDTLRTIIQVNGGVYGIDTVAVTVIK